MNIFCLATRLTLIILLWQLQVSYSLADNFYDDPIPEALKMMLTDAGVEKYVAPAYGCEDGSEVSVKIKNYGPDILTSVLIEWQVNGLDQPPYLWNGSLAAAQTSPSIIIGTYAFSQLSTNSVRTWTSNPNGSADTNTSNDTLVKNGIVGSMKGTFTIGGTAPDYSSINGAIDDLKTFGICGNVIFEIRSGTYNEQLYIPEIPGANNIDTIIFESETGDNALDTLEFNGSSGANYVLQLDGADHLTFRNLTFSALNPEYATAVSIENNATNNNFFGNQFISDTATTPITYLALVNSYGGADDNLTFSGNYFKNGSYGLFLEGSAGGQEENLLIANNTFENQFYRSIHLDFESHALIDGNKFLTTVPTFDNFAAISTFLDVLFLTISNNHLDNLLGSGIILRDATEVTIVNNFISLTEDYGAFTQEGITCFESSEVYCYFNNINVQSNSDYDGCIIIGSEATGIDIKNNVLSNMGGGPPIYYYEAILFYVTSDYNDLYSSGNVLVKNCPAFQPCVDYESLGDWQAFSGKEMNSQNSYPNFISDTDLHIAGNLLLNGTGTPISNLITDIDGDTRQNPPDIGADEFIFASVLDAAMQSIDSVFHPCDDGDIIVAISNFSSSVLTQLTLNWKVDGLPQSPFLWSGFLSPGLTSSQIIIGSFSFLPNQYHSVDVWTSDPNGGNDQFTFNDSISLSFQAPSIAVNIGSDLSICPGDSASVTAGNNYSSYLWSTGETNPTIQVSTADNFSVIVTDTGGCAAYDTMQVTFFSLPAAPVISVNGPAMLSSYITGNQWYFNSGPIPGANSQLYIAEESGVYSVEVTDSNGCKAMSDTVNIIISGVSGLSAEIPSIIITPNPNDGEFFIHLKGFQEEITEVEIVDEFGRKFETIQDFNPTQEKSCFLKLTSVSKGVYFVKVSTKKQVSIQKMVVQ